MPLIKKGIKEHAGALYIVYILLHVMTFDSNIGKVTG